MCGRGGGAQLAPPSHWPGCPARPRPAPEEGEGSGRRGGGSPAPSACACGSFCGRRGACAREIARETPVSTNVLRGVALSVHTDPRGQHPGQRSAHVRCECLRCACLSGQVGLGEPSGAGSWVRGRRAGDGVQEPHQFALTPVAEAAEEDSHAKADGDDGRDQQDVAGGRPWGGRTCTGQTLIGQGQPPSLSPEPSEQPRCPPFTLTPSLGALSPQLCPRAHPGGPPPSLICKMRRLCRLTPLVLSPCPALCEPTGSVPSPKLDTLQWRSQRVPSPPSSPSLHTPLKQPLLLRARPPGSEL